MKGQPKTLVFSVARRSVAVAVFQGTHLDYTDARQLDSDPKTAEAGVVGFVSWIISSFDISSVVLEIMEGEKDTQRAQLYRAMDQSVSSLGCPIYKVGKADVFSAFGQPPLPNRKAVRNVIANIWPILDSKDQPRTKLDAAALGLYIQTERLFQN